MKPDSTPQTHVLEATPSLAAIFAWLAGVPVEKWVALAGLVFILLQIVGYVWRLRRDVRREAMRVSRGDPPSMG